MKGKIASLHWEACETCKHGARPEGGCDIGGDVTFDINYTEEAFICDGYEEEMA